MLINGIGIDIVDVNRIVKAMKYPFAEKILNEKELAVLNDEQLNDPLFLSFVFSAKEAISKANGTGFLGLWFNDIELHFESQSVYGTITQNCAYKNDTKFYIMYDNIKDDNNSKLYTVSKCIASDRNIDPKKLFGVSLSKTCPIGNIAEDMLCEDEKNMKNESTAANIAAKKIIFGALKINDDNLYKKIAISRDEKGKPKILCKDQVIDSKISEFDMKLSLSHEKEIAIAFLSVNKRDDNFEQYI